MQTNSITGTAPYSHAVTNTLLLSEAPAHMRHV